MAVEINSIESLPHNKISKQKKKNKENRRWGKKRLRKIRGLTLLGQIIGVLYRKNRGRWDGGPHNSKIKHTRKFPITKGSAFSD